MIAVYGSKGYDVGREALRTARKLRASGQAFADRVCGDTIRHIWGEWKDGGFVDGWVESKIDGDVAKYFVSFEPNLWASQ